MRSVVRSVKPYWFFLICEGIKTAEVGKDEPQAEDWDKTAYLYCSKDKKSFERIPKEYQEKYRKYLGKIGARFICEKIDFYHQFFIDNIKNAYAEKTIKDIEKTTCVSLEELREYLKGRDPYKKFYIWHISNLVIFDEPRELYDFVYYDKHRACIEKGCFSGDCWGCPNNAIMIRPPQSWCYTDANESEEVKIVAKDREKKLLLAIDKALAELCELHGSKHISAYIINGAVCIEDYTDIEQPKFKYYRGRANDGKNTKGTTDSI